MKKKILFSTALGVMLSFAGLYLALRNIPFSDLFAYFKSISYYWILPATLMVILSFVLRVCRWQLILSSSRDIRFREAYHPLLIGFMINCILPGRVGEIARPVILKQKSQVPFFTGMATVAAERFFDVVMLLCLFVWAASTVDFHSAAEISFGDYHLDKEVLDTLSHHMLSLSLLLIGGIIAVSVKPSRNFITTIILRSPRVLFFLNDTTQKKVRDKICSPLVKLMENMALGFSLVKFPKKIFLCILLSGLIWLCQAYSYYLVTKGCPGISLSLVDIFTVMVIICIFIALPSVPGFWGLWEAGGVFALGLFGIDSKEAVGFTLTNHVVQMLPVIIMGWISAIIISINIRQISYGDRNQEDF